VSRLFAGVRSALWSLLNFCREEAEAESRASSSGAPGAVDALPRTPGVDARSVEAAESGGANGLGPAAHGACLGEDELLSLAQFVRWGADALDVAVYSPSCSAAETQELAAAFTGVLACLEKDRNHLRDVLSSGLPYIIERVLASPPLVIVPELMLS
jgi:hypothetical protein